MKPPLPFHPFLSIIFFAICLVTSSAQSQVLYSQPFTATGNQTLAAWGGGWSGYSGTSATNVTSVAAGAGVDSVSIGFVSSGTSWLLANNNAAAASQSFAAVTTFSSLTVANGSSVTWNMGNANANNTVRLLVQVNGNWYASGGTAYTTTAMSAATFASQLGAGTAPLMTVNFDTSASNWMAFTLTPGSTMTLGATLASPLPSNQITGVGFYIVSSTAQGQATRIDNLVITGVPEASTSAMLVLGLAAIGFAARRRPMAASSLR